MDLLKTVSLLMYYFVFNLFKQYYLKFINKLFSPDLNSQYGQQNVVILLIIKNFYFVKMWPFLLYLLKIIISNCHHCHHSVTNEFSRFVVFHCTRFKVGNELKTWLMNFAYLNHVCETSKDASLYSWRNLTEIYFSHCWPV